MGDESESLAFLLSQADPVSMPRRGDLLHGVILSIDPQGVVVDLGLKRDGVVPRSDLDKVPPDEAKLSVGDEIAVMVIDPVDVDGNLTVSLSQARESGDWLRAQKLMDGGGILEGIPSGYNRGGLIVPFGRLRGFVPASHLTELPRDLDEEGRAAHLKRQLGKKIPLRVIEVDPQRQRLVFSERKAIRSWRTQQKASIIHQLEEGQVRRGVVTSIREFGAFVDIGGADGLIHISEMSWQRVDDPGKIMKVGDEVDVMIIRLDRQANRIGLSLKRLLPNPWESAADRIQPHRILEGVVSRVTSKGPYVRFNDGLEGLVTSPNTVEEIRVGACVKVEVLSFDPSHERLDLRVVEDEGIASPVHAGESY